MRFMMLVIPKGYATAAPSAMPDPKLVEKMMAYNKSLSEAGVLLALDGLHPPSTGSRVTFSGGKPTVTNGPFADAKEVLGGETHACRPIVASLVHQVSGNADPHHGALLPSTRASPTRRVIRSASRYSRSARAYLRDVPRRSRTAATVTLPSCFTTAITSETARLYACAER